MPCSTLLSASQGKLDICDTPPFACDAAGRLLHFIAPAGGFTCPGLPGSLSNLTSLRLLSLSGNELYDSMTHVAEVLRPLTELRRASLGAARLGGALDCGLVESNGLQVGGGEGDARHQWWEWSPPDVCAAAVALLCPQGAA